MNQTINIFWFRRDLRWHDNVALYHALNSGRPVLPIFIFDTAILEGLPQNDARVTFIYETLQALDHTLKKNFNSSIAVFHNDPLEVIKSLTHTYNVDTVFTNHDYEPYARQRDQDIKAYLQSQEINFTTYKDHVVFETNEIVKDNGTPYKVYTPYSKRWMAALDHESVASIPSEQHLESLLKHDHKFPTLETLGFQRSDQVIAPFDTSQNLIEKYEARRNFPATNGTSRLGPHLRFGTVSVRNMVQQAMNSNNNTFLKELIWREFFIHILWHYPQTVTNSFKPQYDNIKWRNNKSEFQAWCTGNTGYPIVDAGMRELNTTGYMHNRVRMIVGSFLCKHLLIDWRWGEAYFAEKLHDYEMASNVGNWQWVAGCGVDAAPYFRIFNPTTQIQKFDKDHDYIKKWVPEYQELTYAQPIVDHAFARERCLQTYASAINKA